MSSKIFVFVCVTSETLIPNAHSFPVKVFGASFRIEEGDYPRFDFLSRKNIELF